jgi:transposase
VDLETALRENAELKAALAEGDARLAERDARLADALARVAVLEKEIADLLEKLGKNSSNSNKPPSSDGPGNRAQRRKLDAKKRNGGRKRGGQPGHAGSSRALIPPEDVDEFVDHYPPACESCWALLPRIFDAKAERYQTIELPPMRPYTVEHRRHCVTCPHCAYMTMASYADIPTTQFGPRLTSIVALLTGVFHVSRRSAGRLLEDILGARISLGAISAIEARVSDALKGPVEEAWTEVVQAPVKHTDGTSWYQSGVYCALWTIAVASATVFKIVANGTKPVLEKLFPNKVGVLVSDRATALTFWAMDQRQICWAHLLRKFIAFSERKKTKAIGTELLDYVGIMFAYWDDVKRGEMTRAEFREKMKPLRVQVEAALARAVATGIESFAGSCEDMLEHRAALWTFVDRDDVEPTNNHAERELRAFVLWRKRSFGTQSDRGNLFAERVMTVVHTARKQNKNVLAFLTACTTAARAGTPPPSLFSA